MMFFWGKSVQIMVIIKKIHLKKILLQETDDFFDYVSMYISR